MSAKMKRRAFITVLGGAVAAWPLAARAQRRDPMRSVGVLMTFSADDVIAQTRVAALLQGLQQAGWEVGRNLRIELRWIGANPEDIRKHAGELADVIVANGSAATGPLLEATRSVPIVFAIVPDPVGAGFIESLARPGGNATGFINFEYGIGAKWLELLKEVAPSVRRVAVLRDPALAVGAGQFGAIQSVAPSFAVELSPVAVRDGGEIERGVAAVARSSNAGLLVTGSAFAIIHRDLIITLAARYKLPAIYFERVFAAAGGLISYGPVFVEQYRQAARYVDRILKGEKPADLPVQAPTKYELVINLKTARALGLEVPPTLLATADEVLE
jgi:putative tryptophan/tyrosine transport system substrate-binding protein